MDRKCVHWRQGAKDAVHTAIEGLYALKMAVHVVDSQCGTPYARGHPARRQ